MSATIIRFPVTQESIARLSRPTTAIGHVQVNPSYVSRHQHAARECWWKSSDIWSDEQRVEYQRKSAVAYAKAREMVDLWCGPMNDVDTEP